MGDGFVVLWKSKDGSSHGYGKPLSQTVAEAVVDENNRKIPSHHHWMISVGDINKCINKAIGVNCEK